MEKWWGKWKYETKETTYRICFVDFSMTPPVKNVPRIMESISWTQKKIIKINKLMMIRSYALSQMRINQFSILFLSYWWHYMKCIFILYYSLALMTMSFSEGFTSIWLFVFLFTLLNFFLAHHGTVKDAVLVVVFAWCQIVQISYQKQHTNETTI